MKSIASVALIILAGLHAEARTVRDTTVLNKGSLSITSIAGEVESTESLCPSGVTCIVDGTIVNLVFKSHGGCLDQMLPIAYTTIGNQVIVHAQVVDNEMSFRAMCAAIPEFRATLQLINLFPPFKIHFLNTSKVLEVK